MPQAKQDAKTVDSPEGYASVLFDKAFEVREQYQHIIRVRKANRDALRSLADQDLLSDDDRALLDELYPPRARNEGTDEATTDVTAAA